MPENQRPEYDAERTRAFEPVRPSGTASERTTQIPASSVREAAWPAEDAWPQEEPDEPSAAPTVRTVPPSDAARAVPGEPARDTAPPADAAAPGSNPPAGAVTHKLNPPAGAVTHKLNPPAEQSPAEETRAVAPDRGAAPDATRAFPPAGDPRGPSPAEATTVFATPVPPPEAVVHGPLPVDDDRTAAEEGDERRKRRRRVLLVAAGVLGLLVVLYGADILISGGNVPRGVTVAGVDVGGLSHPAAEQKLRETIGPRLAQPVQARAGDVTTGIDPKAAGLELDWAATLDRAGDQPLSPITRITSFFTSREVGFATRSDDAKLTAALEALRAQTDHEPAEGTIRFEGATPVAVDPKQGQKLDVPGASEKLLADWADGGSVELPVAVTPVKTTKEGVQKALAEFAEPATSAPVVVKGEGKDATLTPEQLGATLVFEPVDGGGLAARVDNNKVVEAAGPQLKETEKEGKDAEIVFEGGKPTVKESVDGLAIDWEKSLATFMDVLKSTDKREIKAEYKHTPAEVTTEQANKMGIKEVIGEFQTGNFAADSGVNIRVVAEEVNGAIVKPHETFSLNGHTGPRGLAQGYVEAGIIENGAPGRAVGGGISQFATTLYNAAYTAGMKDAGHKEHSYWISRYPAGREATVFMDNAGNSLIDIAFTNPDDTGVAIQTIWTPSSIRIVLWGTKNYDVTGSTSERTDFTEPNEVKKTTQPCVNSPGAQGFTVTDTRTIKDRRTGQTRSESRTVRYDPSPKIVCEAPPAG